MSKQLTLRVQNLILIMVIPAILLVVIVMASILYSNLYRIILDGFEQKLFALGSTVASFIDGDEHREISDMQQFRGVAYRQGKLYANTFTGVHLLEIDPTTGDIQSRPNEIGYEGIGGLTYVPQTDKIYGVTYEVKELIAIDPVTGKGTLIGTLEHDVFGIAYDKNSDNMVGATYEELVNIDYVTGTSSSVGSLDGLDIQGLTFHQKKLIAVETESSTLYELDPQGGVSKKRGEIVFPSGNPILFGTFGITSDGADFFAATTVPIFKVTIDGVATKISLSDSKWQRGHDLYAKYVLPMIRLKNKEDATFLYSALLKDQAKQIYYNLDSTQSSIHSFIGYTDPDEADEDLRDVWLKGYTFLSDIIFWEEWGLLKSSYIPIKSKTGEITGYAGADVNIDVINNKTKKMLVFIVLAGLLAIFLAILISLTMARTLTQPIEALKRAALKIASGSFGLNIAKSNITELGELAGSFNILSSSLDSKIATISGEIKKKDEARIQREVINQLTLGEPSHLLSKWTSDNVQIGIAQKLIAKSNILFFWKIAPRDFSDIEKVNISTAIRVFIHKEAHFDSTKALANQISVYFEKFLDYFGVIDPHKEKLQFYSPSNSSMHLSLLDGETGKIKKTIAASSIEKNNFEDIKSSYFLLFGDRKTLEQLQNVKADQLKKRSLTLMMETINRFLGIQVEAALGSA